MVLFKSNLSFVSGFFFSFGGTGVYYYFLPSACFGFSLRFFLLVLEVEG
jgi:hypothetical protein